MSQHIDIIARRSMVKIYVPTYPERMSTMVITTVLEASDIDALRQPQLSRAPKFNFVSWLICMATRSHKPYKTYFVGSTRRGEEWLVRPCCGRRKKFANVRHVTPH